MINQIEVTCAILLEGDKVLCAQRSEEMSHPLKWEFPGGKIEEGESPEECLKREVKEELNLEIKVNWAFKPNLHVYQVGKVIKLMPFMCEYLGGELFLKEHKSVVWLPVDQLKKLDWAAADIPIVDEFIKWFSQK
jgi:8-oxo-dGTP diphosphatase